jgi:glycosyltransferase involved in cell wall biosynthesis
MLINNNLKVLALTKYGRLGASSRLRIIQYLPWLEKLGLDVTVQPLLPDDMLKLRYDLGGYRLSGLIAAYYLRLQTLKLVSSFDVLWIEKEALPWVPLWIERFFLHEVPYILDYDDAVFHQYDLHPRELIRKFYGSRLDQLMADAALVIGGNEYLAQRARAAGAQKVEILATVVDLERYSVNCNISCFSNEVQLDLTKSPRIVWIGSPATIHYLELMLEPLQTLAKRVHFILRIIGGRSSKFPGINIESLEWSEDTEAESLKGCAIGVMPLLDSSWERGKCGYKLIQYMASAIPVVASPVGVNVEIVEDGVSGFFADGVDEWVSKLELLLKDASLRSAMGQAGRKRVEEKYCVQQVAPRLASLLLDAGKKNVRISGFFG